MHSACVQIIFISQLYTCQDNISPIMDFLVRNLQTLLLLMISLYGLNGNAAGSDSCTFSSQPTSISVNPGDPTSFGCDCQEERHATPVWIINNVYYIFSSLPSSYKYNSGLSVLEISEVTTSMNLTTIQCYVGTLLSTVGILYVLENEQHTPKTNSTVNTKTGYFDQSSTIFTCTGETLHLT